MKWLALLLVTLLLSAAIGIGVYLAVNEQPTNPIAQMAPCGRILFFESPTTCPDCLAMETVIENARIDNLLHIDVDKDPAMAERWHIGREIPVFIGLNDDGYEVRRIVGTCTANDLCLLQFDAMKAGKPPITMQPIPLVRQVQNETPSLNCPPNHHEPNCPTAKTAASAAPNTIRGPDGWRLRLYYPRGNAHGAKLAKQLGAMKAIAAKYGFAAVTTDQESFKAWGDRLSADAVTLVLIHPDERIVYQESKNIPTDPIELREDLRDAARESWKGMK